jgi:hypothetical protein
MPTARAYGALPNVPRIFRTGTALCWAPRWRTAPARPAVIQTDDEQSRDATNTKFIGHAYRAQHVRTEDVRQKSHGFCGAGCTAPVPAQRPQCQLLGTRDEPAMVLDVIRSDEAIECRAGSVA